MIGEPWSEVMKEYIGDGVYVNFDSARNIMLTTEDRSKTTNVIYLERLVWDALVEWVKRHGN